MAPIGSIVYLHSGGGEARSSKRAMRCWARKDGYMPMAVLGELQVLTTCCLNPARPRGTWCRHLTSRVATPSSMHLSSSWRYSHCPMWTTRPSSNWQPMELFCVHIASVLWGLSRDLSVRDLTNLVNACVFLEPYLGPQVYYFCIRKEGIRGIVFTSQGQSFRLIFSLAFECLSGKHQVTRSGNIGTWLCAAAHAS